MARLPANATKSAGVGTTTKGKTNAASHSRRTSRSVVCVARGACNSTRLLQPMPNEQRNAYVLQTNLGAYCKTLAASYASAGDKGVREMRESLLQGRK